MRENGVNNGVLTDENGGLNGVAVDPVADFLAACAAAPDGAVVRVARVVSGTRQYLPETVEPAEFAPEWLGERFGGGRFFVSLVVPGRGYAKGCTVSVFGAAAPAAAAAAPAAAPASGGSLDAASIMAAALSLLQSTMSQQTQVLSSLLSRPSDGLKVADIVALVKGGNGGGLSDAVDALRGLAELSGGLGGSAPASSGGSSDPMAAVAAAVLPSLLAANRAAPAAASARPRRPVTADGLEARAARLEAAASAARSAAAARRALAVVGGRGSAGVEAAARAAAAADWVEQRAGLEAAPAAAPAPAAPAPAPPVPAAPAAAAPAAAAPAPAAPAPAAVDDWGGTFAAEYPAVRDRMAGVFQSVGGPPDWLAACLRRGLDESATGAKLGADLVAECEAAAVEVPNLDPLEVAAVLDLVTESAGLSSRDDNRRRRWISAVCGPVADALGEAAAVLDDEAEGDA